MMSRTLSINLLKGETRRKLWLYIITIILTLMLRPARLLMAIDSIMLWGTDLPQAEKINQVILYARFGSTNNLMLVFVLAIAYAFACFGYLYSKSKIDLYHSIPVKRKTMYGVFSISAIIPYYLVEILVLLCNLGILAMKGMLVSYSARILITTFLYNLVVFVLIFSLTAIVIFITGQILTGVLGTIVILFGWASIVELIDSYKGFSYQTYMYDDSFKWLNFVLSPVDAVSKLTPCVGNGISKFVVLLVETVIIFGLGMVLYIRKPSDSVNKSLSYKILNPVLRIPFVIGSALMGGLYVAYLSDNLTVGWFWAAFVIAGIFAHCLANGIIHSDIKMVMKNWLQLIISLVAAAAIAMFFVYDVSGYDRYLPKADKIDYVSIDFTGLHDDISYYKLVEGAGGYSFEYESGEEYRLNHMESKNIATVLELAMMGIDNLDSRKSAFDRRDNNNGVEPLRNMAVDAIAAGTVFETEDVMEVSTMDGDVLTYDDQPNQFKIRYHLKNGKDVYRMYSVSMDDSFAATEKIYNTEEYKDSIIQLKDFVDNDKIAMIRGTDRVGVDTFTIRDEQAVAFIEALEKDYKETTLVDMANELPVCSISSGSATDSYDSYTYGYYIYPSFKNSLALLESYGITVDTSELKMDVDRISSIVVTRYNYETGEQKQITYEKGIDDDIIKTFADVMIMDNYTYVNSVLRKYEQNVDVECNYIADNGYLYSYYMRVERGDVPKETLNELGFNVQ